MRTPTALATLVLTAVLGCSHLGPGGPEKIPSDVLAEWNQLVLELAEEEDRFLTLKGLRTAAMVHLAIHDSLQAIAPRYEPYLAPSSGAPSEVPADPVATAAAAAHAVAVEQYPQHRERLDERLAIWLEKVEESTARELALKLGGERAHAILGDRRGDGWDGEPEYRWHPMAPGVYAEFNQHSGTPEGFVFGAGWAEARPFMLDAPDHFRSPPPPAIASPSYAKAFDEVRQVGRFDSQQRTADQSHLALWWKEFVESSHNRLARRLMLDEGADLWSSARFFALLNMTIYDSYINVFENKFHYNHWRPYTAIRWAAEDGNPATHPEPDWDNHHRHTYAFPSYPSAHGTACAAAMEIFAETFGGDRPFAMETPEVDRAGPLSEKIPMDPAVRHFDRFADAAVECGQSRIYLGIHFRYDAEAGTDLGRQVGAFAIESFLRPRSP
ncbi:MAG: vanadium-dependent haloperoxidase [Acidobacteriota bacterium]